MMAPSAARRCGQAAPQRQTRPPRSHLVHLASLWASFTGTTAAHLLPILLIPCVEDRLPSLLDIREVQHKRGPPLSPVFGVGGVVAAKLREGPWLRVQGCGVVAGSGTAAYRLGREGSGIMFAAWLHGQVQSETNEQCCMQAAADGVCRPARECASR